MGLTLVNAPALDPISLSEAKAHLRVDTSDSDGLIAGYLIAARQYAETYTRRACITQTWDLTLDFDWPCARVGRFHLPRIELPLPPLQSVTSITYVDAAGVSQALPSDQYRVDKSGIVGVIDPAYSVEWPSVRPQTAAITVRFVAGYGSNPGDVDEKLRAAIRLHVEILFDRDPTARESLERARDDLLYPCRVLSL